MKKNVKGGLFLVGCLDLNIQSSKLQLYIMKKQIMSIDFKKDAGVVLKWNYNDLSRANNYFRHILVILSARIQLAEFTVSNYIKSMKLGDLYTTLYSSSSSTPRKKSWRQKINKSDFSFRTYFQEQKIFSLTFETAAPIFEREIEQSDEPTILNFIIQGEAQIESLKKMIKERQIENKIKFVSTIFTPICENNISIVDGINTFSLEEQYIFDFYHNYLHQMAIERAHLTISCRNGQIGSSNQQIWKNTAFNKIQRSYYGPSIKYEQDALRFLNTKSIFHGSYDLDLHLQLKCFGGKTYVSHKKITISFDRSNIYNRTFLQPKKKKFYHSISHLQLEETPFQTQTNVYFEQSNAETISIADD